MLVQPLLDVILFIIIFWIKCNSIPAYVVCVTLDCLRIQLDHCFACISLVQLPFYDVSFIFAHFFADDDSNVQRDTVNPISAG